MVDCNALMMEKQRLVSVTDLSAYQFCTRALYLRLVLGLREPVKPVMLLGGIRHRIYDEANKREEGIVNQIAGGMDRQSILSLFSDAYNEILQDSVSKSSLQLGNLGMDGISVASQLGPAVLSQAHSRADEIISFSSKAKLFGSDLWEALTPKIITELSVRSKRLRLKGVVDRIEIYGNEYVPVEIKTGRTPSEGVWPDHRLQIASYMLLLNDKFNVNVKEGMVKYVATDQTRQVVMNPFLEYEITAAVNDLFNLVESPDVPESCGKSYCGVCRMGENYENLMIKRPVRR